MKEAAHVSTRATPIAAGVSNATSTQASPTPTSDRGGAPDQSRPLANQQPAVGAPLVLPPNQQPSRSLTRTLNPNREIFGFATSGSLSDPSFGYPSWNFDLLSTVAFFAIHAQYNGVLIADSNWDVWSSSALTGLVNMAHAHGAKVVVTLVGPGDPVDQCDSLYNGLTTVQQIVDQVRLKGIDGVNIDYEGQLRMCQNNNPALNELNQTLLTDFAKNMRAALDAVRPGLYLSIDTYSGSAAGTDGFFNIPNLNLYVDSFFVMAYDMDYANQDFAPLTCSGPLGLRCLNPISPLTNYNYNDTISMGQYSAVVGAGKVILGQPYYGRVACVASPVEHATPTSGLTAVTYVGAATVAQSVDVQPGTFVVHRDANDPTGWDRWDSWYDLSYGCWREMYWEDVTTLGTRYNFVNQQNLRGVGFWTLNYGGGSPELWSELQAYFVSCGSAGVSAIPTTPQLSGTNVQMVATSTNCNNPLYEFWILPPGGTWTLAQPYSSSAIFNWTTGGKPAGSYLVSVWARAANTQGLVGSPPNSYDAYTTLSYALTTSPCTGMSAAPSPATTAPIGTQVTVTGNATGCPNPSYEFWLLPPGGSWTIVQGYSTSATFNWGTAGKAAGTYQLSVWARDASSLGTSGSGAYTYDAVSAFQYQLTIGPCTALNASSSPPSTANVGTAVNISGAASGCPIPLYQFWFLAPGGQWTVVQPYATGNTFAWNTAGWPKGSYWFSVWVRDAASPGAKGSAANTYDVANAFQFALTVAPCTAMSVSSAPPITATVGTRVTITGSATGCLNPLYQFWMLTPGGTWTVAQPYSSSTTFNWSTVGRPAGSYWISAWARDVSSSSSYDAYAAIQYPLTIAPCTATSASAAPPTTATVGTLVTITGNATGCPNPLYQFWMLVPGGVWTVVQPYSSSPSFNWNTSRPIGSYWISVWARDASSSSSYDSFGAFQYALT